MIGDNFRERFENLALSLTVLGIAAILLALYGLIQPPKPMKEPVIVKVERRTKVAVLDTGLQLSNEIRPYLCKEGHYSLVDSSPLTDESPSKHGTNVAGLIAQNLNPNFECLLIIKMIGPYSNSWEWSTYTQKAVTYAMRQNVKFVNMSFGGPNSSNEEFKLFQEAIKKGVHLSVAAGNDNNDLDKKCYYFPACYIEKLNTEYFHAVGSSTGKYANHGKIIPFLEDGTNKGGPIPLEGTSQATAIHTGKWVRRMATK